MERSGGDKQDMIGLHIAILRLHGRPFDDRQQVTLHALPRDVLPTRAFDGHDLVDLVEKDDAQVFGQLDRLGVDLLLIDQRFAFLLE